VAILAMLGVDTLLGLLIGSLGGALKNTPLDISSLLNLLESGSIAVNFAFYSVSRLIGLGLIYLLLRRRRVSLREFGFRKFSPKVALVSLAIAVAIMIIGTIVVFAIVSALYPQVDLEQAQDVVFKNAANVPQIILAFIALVVIAPLAEESIFRGLLLPAFAKKIGFIMAAIVTSIMFGAIHGQLNVAIVTFILGLLLAWMYKRTNSLWPAIMLHSLKNLIAFALIYLKI
jgi:membrane protease YdiL (CAAX protease family)